MNRDTLTRVLGSEPIAGLSRRLVGGALRILAYHDVADRDTFALHLAHLQARYRLVSGSEVAAAIRESRELAPLSVWITFDDAHAGVFRNALPALAERSAPATLFVCPGVVDTTEPYWWQVLDAALGQGQPLEFDARTWTDRSLVTHLKHVSDTRRREYVAVVRESLQERGAGLAVEQATTAQLRAWLDAGLEVGNHTWDHPCLTTCTEAEQTRQLSDAHAWFRDALGLRPELFAYPNGDHTDVSSRLLSERGYSVKLLFDHRLAHPTQRELSRLRVDADAPVPRLAAIASGAHPALFRVARALQRRDSVSPQAGEPA